MKNIQAKELKIKFIEILNQIENFSYEDGNPFLIELNNSRYFVFLKNISSAYFKASPDVTRVQLPSSERFSKIVETEIPFVILGYDTDNDTIVGWNPHRVKDRLNSKGNVSLYSRESLQSKIKTDDFREGFLSNGEKIIIFNRKKLPLFFENLPRLFDDSGKITRQARKALANNSKERLNAKLFEIVDKQLLAQIKPILKKNRVLEAVETCSKFYGNKYKSMSFKDWFKVVDNLYQKSNY